jgi:hypothetical protein
LKGAPARRRLFCGKGLTPGKEDDPLVFRTRDGELAIHDGHRRIAKLAAAGAQTVAN